MSEPQYYVDDGGCVRDGDYAEADLRSDLDECEIVVRLNSIATLEAELTRAAGILEREGDETFARHFRAVVKASRRWREASK